MQKRLIMTHSSFQKKANFLQTIGIMFCSSLSTLNICGQAIVKGLLGKLRRQDVDELVQNWSIKLLKYLKARIYVHDEARFLSNPVLLNKPTIIMCNHSSLYDIPLTFLTFPNRSVRMLAKKELFKIPVFGWAMKHSSFPSIDRENRAQAKLDLAYAKQLLNEGYMIWIAPEGTRSTSKEFLPLKKGGFMLAFECEATILPVYIHGANELLPAKTWHFHTGKEINIYIGEPFATEGLTVQSRDSAMRHVIDEWTRFQKNHVSES